MKKLLFLLFSFLLVCCNFNKTYENRESDKEDAKKVTDRFYYLIQENNKQEAFNLFSNRFFEKFGKDKINQILDDTDSEFGKVKNYELVDSWTQIIKGTNPISKYELSYLVTRDSTQTKEHFKMQKENDTIKIIAYRLDFDVVPKK